MKIKTFEVTFSSNLDKKVNEFISRDNIEVSDIKFSSSFMSVCAMIIYNDK